MSRQTQIIVLVALVTLLYFGYNIYFVAKPSHGSGSSGSSNNNNNNCGSSSNGQATTTACEDCDRKIQDAVARAIEAYKQEQKYGTQQQQQQQQLATQPTPAQTPVPAPSTTTPSTPSVEPAKPKPIVPTRRVSESDYHHVYKKFVQDRIRPEHHPSTFKLAIVATDRTDYIRTSLTSLSHVLYWNPNNTVIVQVRDEHHVFILQRCFN